MSTPVVSHCPHCGRPIEDHLNPHKFFAQGFREIREECGKTKQDFADILKVEIAEIEKMESGEIRPDVEQQLELASALDISPLYFAGRSLHIKQYKREG